MSVIIDGTNGINTPNTFAFKNRIIDGGFTINQRGYVTNTSLTSGSYGHDRWKGGASNGTYTFTQASAGVNTTITITAGSIIQVIEGANLPEGGTYVLSWTGTAQGKIGAGSFGASGITGTITAGTNTNIEFNTGTCGNVQLEVGSTATSFDYRPFGTELQLCQRYYMQYGGTSTNEHLPMVAQVQGTTNANTSLQLPVQMRTTPSITQASTWQANVYGGSSQNISSFAISDSTPLVARLDITLAGSLGSSGQCARMLSTSTAARLNFSAEL
jgi:hypothetical protein